MNQIAPTTPYRDRRSAGEQMARELHFFTGVENLLILAIPRGGVAVAAPMAKALGAHLDVFVVQPIVVQEPADLCIGAIASGGVCALHQDVLGACESNASEVAEQVVTVRQEVLAREKTYRCGRAAQPIAGRHVILVDEGTGSDQLMKAAVAAVRSCSPSTLTIATPVASALAAERLADQADDFVCPHVIDPFFAVGLAYERYPDVDDIDVCSWVSTQAPPLQQRHRPKLELNDRW